MNEIERDDSPRALTSRRWYVICGVLFLIAATLFGVSLAHAYNKLTTALSDFQRVVIPAGGQVTLDANRTCRIYYESRSQFAGQSFNTPRPMPAVQLTLVHQQTGQSVSLEPTHVTETYDFPSASGYAIYEFDTAGGGVFDVAGRRLDGSTEPMVLAFGRLEVFAMVGSVFGVAGAAIVLAFVTTLGVVLCIVVFLRRRQTS